MDKTPLRDVVAANVKAAMKAHPIYNTQAKLGERAGVAQSHMSRLLKGGNVSLDVVQGVAKALGRRPYELMMYPEEAKTAMNAMRTMLNEWIDTHPMGLESIPPNKHVSHPPDNLNQTDRLNRNNLRAKVRVSNVRAKRD